MRALYVATMIEAAGGVVVRTWHSSAPEVLLVHRPSRQDWSLPKGKLQRRETAIECALREVHEETGLRCTAHHELPPVRYVDRRGRPRRVRYWMMEAITGEFVPNDEVDDICWARIDTVGEMLTYARELTVVSGLAFAISRVA